MYLHDLIKFRTVGKKIYTITTALPYANGPLHLGHVAGVYIPADIYARYMRLQGHDVLLVGGSDEHGVPVTIRAKKEGITPQDVVDRYHGMIKESLEQLGVSLDIYSRTSDQRHHETAQQFFTEMNAKNIFQVETSEQYYDEENKEFLADRYITGECPHCGNEEAYGDQCEKCGTALSPTELINPKSALSGNEPILKETKHWYLPLDKYQPWLEEWIVKGHKDDWKSNVYGQCKSWLDQGLQPRAITRDLEWGIKVPLEEAEGKVLYVWFEAPIGYISATKHFFEENEGAFGGKNWEHFWKKQENSEEDPVLIHFLGKDNIVFHGIIFPTMLHSHGEYVVPANVAGQEFLNLEGDKFSTSRNYAVWLHDYLKDFEGRNDELKYTLTAYMPETKDNNFTWKGYQDKVNNELVAILGNFVNRALVLTHKYYGGEVPTPNELQQIDKDAIQEMQSIPDQVSKSMEAFRIREAAQAAMELARLGNKYLADTEPWQVVKTDEERVKTIMYVAMQIATNLTTVLSPFLPDSCEKLAGMIGMEKGIWEDAKKTERIASGHKINKPSLLFTKIEDKDIEVQLAKLEEIKKQAEIANADVAGAKDAVTFDDFTKMDIRIGTILEAEKVKKTKKLLKLKVDTGIDQRTVVSGIAEYYAPEEIIGKQVSILVNLAPRAIKGIESQGMILMAENAAGELAFVSPEKEVNNGGEVR